MFNSEFYPTPLHVLDLMAIDCYDKVVWEPSAGKGDVIDYLWTNGAREVLSTEQNKDLALICSAKSQFLGYDCFAVKAEQISHINMIVANPPFSNADKHILHMWEIAPEGTEIIALCNWETLNNDRGYSRSELGSLISKYGTKDNLKNVFSTDSERTTDVEIGLVRLFKPVLSDDFDWDGFFYESDYEGDGNGIMPYNDVRAIVNTYVAAVKCFDEALAIGKRLSSLVGTTAFNISISSDKNHITTKEQFAREFQIKQWNKVFNILNIEKYVTTGVMKDVNKLTSSRLNYPFTMKNIYRMLEIIVGTRENTMNKAIVEAVDNFTRNTFENQFGVEGWKTNSGHLLNKKFILDGIAGYGWGSTLKIDEYGNSYRYGYLMDLVKALCYITGTNIDSFGKIQNAPVPRDEKGEMIKKYKYLNPDGTPQERMKQYFEYENVNDFTPNTWYDWGFFTFKVYKKGTMHAKFKDEKVWELLNRTYAKIKGMVLPDKL